MFLAYPFRRRAGAVGALAAVAVSFSAAIALALMAGCSNSAPAGGGPLVVPLTYTPEHAQDDVKAYPGEVPHTRIFVGSFEDKREAGGNAIGQNVEHQNPVRIVSGSPPAEFVRQTLATQLRRAGLTLTDDPAQADRIISGDLTRFWVEESNNYQAEVGATIRVTERGGESRWQGAVVGHGENFGRSLSPENYREALSDAMVRMTYDNLLTNPGFQNALK
jgi:hypothetical protein